MKLRGLIFALTAPLFLFLAAPGCSAQVRTKYISGKKYYSIKDLAGRYGMKYSPGGDKCTISGQYGSASFLYDKKEGTLNGVMMYYLDNCVRSEGDTFVSEQDVMNVLEPMFAGKKLASHKMRVIVIDPGHGDFDRGATGKLYNEKDLTLQIALKLRDILRQKGYIVYMTRDSDQFIPLPQRCSDAAKKGADLFISVHVNSTLNPMISGVETFCLTPSGSASTYDAKAKGTNCAGNAFDGNNCALAVEAHRAIIKNTGALDRGVKHSRFLVLRNAPCPAILIETGFISNSKEERALGRQSYQQTIANSIAEGVVNYNGRISARKK